MDNSIGDKKTMSGGVAADRSVGDQPTLPSQSVSQTGRRFRAGEVILGRYRVTDELGQGGMGVVYRCFDETAGIDVALKALPPEVAHNSGEMDEVRENFRLVSRLHHPNIANVNTLEKDSSTGDYYLVMECVDGLDLRQWARKRRGEGRPLNVDEVRILAYRIASALDYAHGQKVIHRDIKPSNVRVTFDGDVKVLDFGLAAQLHTSLSRVSQAYRGTSGTGPYMAPEQWRGKRQGAEADQYALAATAYELLSGVPPFESHDPAVLREAVLKEPPPPLEGVPPHVNAALLRGLSKEPEGRFTSCGEFVAALGASSPQAATGRKAALLLAGAATLVAVLVLSFTSIQSRNARLASERAAAEQSARQDAENRAMAAKQEADRLTAEKETAEKKALLKEQERQREAERLGASKREAEKRAEQAEAELSAERAAKERTERDEAARKESERLAVEKNKATVENKGSIGSADNATEANMSCLLVQEKSQIIEVKRSGETKHVCAFSGTTRASVLEDELFVYDSIRARIDVYGLSGELRRTINVPKEIHWLTSLVVTPDRRIAILDNKNDVIYFLSEQGSLLKTVPFSNTPNNELQNMEGVVVGNRLVVSETGNNEIFAVDLSSYKVSLFLNLNKLRGWLGSITYNHGAYYICQSREIYTFKKDANCITKVATIPEGNITGITTMNGKLFAVINGVTREDANNPSAANSDLGVLYEIDPRSMRSSTMKKGLFYPKGLFVLSRSKLEEIKGPAAGEPWTSPASGMEFVWVSELKLWVGKYEVTNGEYRKKEPAHDSKGFKGRTLNGDLQPVVFVNFIDAKAYAEWLTKQDGSGLDGLLYRVISETEWQTCAQCGDGRKFPWGNSMPPRWGNYCGQETEGIVGGMLKGCTDRYAVACPVDKSGANEWGLYGLGGNVWECCASGTSGSAFGAWRGASWSSGAPNFLLCESRSVSAGADCGDGGGFRLVLSHPLP